MGIILAYLVLILWSVFATIWIYPVHVGVACSIFFLLMLLLTMIFISQLTQRQLFDLFSSIDRKIIRRAWLESKSAYVENRNAFNRSELVTYEELV